MRSRLGLKIFSAVIVVGTISYVAWFESAKKQADTEVANARRVGLWTTPADLQNRPRVPEAQNAAAILQPLCASFERQNSEMNHLDLGDDAVADSSFLQAEPYIKQFLAAGKRPYCQFERNWSDPAAVTYLELSQLKSVVKLCSARSLSLSRKGQPREGLSLLSEAAPLAKDAGSDPMLIAPLVQIAIDGVVFSNVQDVLGAHGLDPGVPEAADLAISALGPVPDVKDSLRGECATITHVFDDGNSVKDLFGPDQKWLAFKGRFAPVRLQWKAEMLRRFQDLYSVFDSSDPSTVALLLRAKQVDAKHASEVTSDLSFGASTITEVLISDISRRNLAHLFAKQLEAWRTSGKAPTSLIQTTPPLTDPYTGKPYQFAVIPHGFKIWGCGRDGQDHGGVSKRPGGGGSEGDIVFQYPYVAPITAKKASAKGTVSGPKLSRRPMPRPLGGPTP